jgi:uncharacterized protein
MAWFKPKINGVRIFFATDIHGSETCWRKFINAAQMYSPAHLILGGDILGKHLVAIQHDNGGYSAEYGERRYTGLSSSGLTELQDLIRKRGDYFVVGTSDEVGQLRDPMHCDRTFRTVARASIEDWVALAEERLRGTGVRCFMAPGNDDFLEIDVPIEASQVVEFAENRRIRLDETYEMITTGYSNPTPWKTERELEEPQLKDRIDRMAAGVQDAEHLVAVLHAPPYDSGIDAAPELTADLRQVTRGGAPSMRPVGSTAVRAFIEERQPLLGLHGHVHEAGGVAKIGRTTCINPGSEYTEGRLCGALVALVDRKISHQFVNG